MVGLVDEDLSLFFIEGEFSVSVSIETESQTLTVVGQFEDPHALSELGDYEYTEPARVFTCSHEAVQGVSRGDKLTYEGVTYHIIDVEPDGTGLCAIRLSP